MLVKYLGEFVRERKSYGCSRCGTSRAVGGKEVHKISFTTWYNGRLYVFNKDSEVEVDEILAKFLLAKTYTDTDGTIKHSFEQVNEVEG